MKRVDMNIPYIGEVSEINTYSSSAFILNTFVNIKLYWERNSAKSQLKIISAHLNNIEGIIENNVFKTIFNKLCVDKDFKSELIDIAFRNGTVTALQSIDLIMSRILSSLVVKDIFISAKNGDIAFHIYLSKAKEEMVEVILDFSLTCKNCTTKYRPQFLSLDSYSSFTFFELNYFFDESYYKNIEESVEWSELIAGKKSERLRNYLSRIKRYRSQNQKGVIGNDAWHISRSFLELNGLYSVYTCFKDEGNHDLKEHIKFITKGVSFKYDGLSINNDKCRDFLFELKVASDYLKSGYDISVNERADIVINDSFYIECKKISSKKKFITRLTEAIEQLEGESEKGVIYIDATDLIDISSHPLVINDKRIDLPNKNGVVNTDNRVTEDLHKVASSACQKLLDEYKNKIFNKLGDYLLVVHFEFSCLHFSPIHERAANLILRYVVSNETDSEIKYLVESSF